MTSTLSRSLFEIGPFIGRYPKPDSLGKALSNLRLSGDTNAGLQSMAIPRRYIECTALVALWIACGEVFELSTPAYALLGVPLIAVFQLAVVRKPICNLWVREADRFRLDRWGILIAIGLMVVPAHSAYKESSIMWRLVDLCGVVGAPFAAFALRSQSSRKLKEAFPSFGATVLIGGSSMAMRFISKGLSPGFKASFLLGNSVLIFPMLFVLEEVAFRGALDGHIMRAQGKRLSEWGSAMFVSVLWALWHLPVAHGITGWWLVRLAGSLLVGQILVGVPLSFCWRKSGTLVLPAAAHALLDAYRNAITGGPR